MSQAQRVSIRSGADYLLALKGREIYESGVRIDDPATAPSTARMARTIADLLDEGAAGGPMADADGFPAAYALAASAEDVHRRGLAFRHMARRSGGLMGRSPDFLATIVTAWRGASGHFGDQAGRVEAYWARARASNLVLTHAISDPPADRHLPTAAGGRLRTLRAVGRSSEGLVVRGAKMLATLAPFADELLVYPFRPLTGTESDQALCFAVPLNTPGLTLYCRPSMASGSPRESPFAARFDEMDAITVFDDVVVPWDRVFIDDDPDRANRLRAGTGMTAYAWHQSAVRAWTKAELVFELANACAVAAGKNRQDVPRQQLGELAGIVETFRGLVVSGEAGARRDQHGHFTADPIPLAASGMLNATLYSRAVELLQLIVGSGLVSHPVESDEDPGSASHAFFEQYFAGVDVSGVEHGVLLRAAADLAMNRFGSRQSLYERVFLGPPDAFRGRFYEQFSAARPPTMLADLLP